MKSNKNIKDNQQVLHNSPNFRVVSSKDLNSISFNITWNSFPIRSNTYKSICRWVRYSRDYAPITPEKLRLVSKYVNKVNAEYKTKVHLDQAISIRNVVIKDKIIRGYNRMNQNIERVAREYNGGTDIMILSMKNDFPPRNLLRGIFIYNGMSSKQIYNIFANKENPGSLLTGRDLEQFHIAEKNDAESTFNIQLIADIANSNELVVTNYFRSIGVGLVDQIELVEAQQKEHGRAILTPDILFVDPVIINGTPVRWIDYKDYVGTPISFLYDSNAAQAAKYYNEWGTGAFCFHKSFVEGLSIPGAILLDARSLPVKLKI